MALKFCYCCQKERDESGFKSVKTSNGSRLKCAACQKRTAGGTPGRKPKPQYDYESSSAYDDREYLRQIIRI